MARGTKVYIPGDFQETDPQRIAALLARHSFALLVTVDANGRPFASHLPLFYDSSCGENGTLLGLMARANPQWRQFNGGPEALAVFSGPHAYVSPSWYEAHPSVPTWNYAAVHAYGRPRVVADDAARAILARLVDQYEAGFAKPWRMALLADYEAAMLKGIVAFEIEITKLEAKFKMSQNRTAADRRNVTERLAAEGSDDAAELARLMREADYEPR